jgi:ribosomal protein S18 acetylase RimI-like enzyme
MQSGDLPTLAECLPEVLSGNWSVAHLQSQMVSSHEFLVLVRNDAAQETAVQETIGGFAEFYCVVDECHLLNFAILRRWQQQGLGRIFMRELQLAIHKRDCVRCLLEVRRSNQQAIRFYEKTGFILDGVRRAYYPPLDKDGAREDALLYSLSLSTSC